MFSHSSAPLVQDEDTDPAGADDWVALFKACGRGDDSTVLQLLRAGVPVNEQTETGESALMQADWNRYVHVVRLSIDHDASVDMTDNHNWSPVTKSAHVER